MRGFLVGSFALVVLYVALRPNSPKAVAAGGNVLVAGLRRVLSPDVAGIPQRKGAGALGNGGTGVGQAAGAGAAAGANFVGGN